MPLPLKSGEVLRGRYRIVRIIGQGGMGSIYLADDLRLEGRQCALKEVEHDRSLPPDLLQEARDQFFREATVLARLDHPNLPKVSDFFSTGSRDYLVMDFIPGRDLRSLMMEAKQENRFLSETEVLNWADQLASALSYLHNQTPPHSTSRYKTIQFESDSQRFVKIGRFWAGQGPCSRRDNHHRVTRAGYRTLHPTGTVRRR